MGIPFQCKNSCKITFLVLNSPSFPHNPINVQDLYSRVQWDRLRAPKLFHAFQKSNYSFWSLKSHFNWNQTSVLCLKNLHFRSLLWAKPLYRNPNLHNSKTYCTLISATARNLRANLDILILSGRKHHTRDTQVLNLSNEFGLHFFVIFQLLPCLQPSKRAQSSQVWKIYWP